MENIVTQLTSKGLFFVLGKLYYAQALLEARFDEEEAMPDGVEQALSEIEDAKEPLLRVLFGPPDECPAFVKYLKETYDLELDIILDSGIVVDDGLVCTRPRLSLVKNEE